MTVARIPFTPEDEGAIRQLTGAAMFLLVVNFIIGAFALACGCFSFVGVPANFGFHPMAGVGSIMTALGIVLGAFGMVGQGALLFQIRQALEAVVQSDTNDQAHLALAFSRLKMYFLIEVVLFATGMFLQCGGFLTQAFGPVNPMMQGGGFGGGM